MASLVSLCLFMMAFRWVAIVWTSSVNITHVNHHSPSPLVNATFLTHGRHRLADGHPCLPCLPFCSTRSSMGEGPATWVPATEVYPQQCRGYSAARLAILSLITSFRLLSFTSFEFAGRLRPSGASSTARVRAAWPCPSSRSARPW